MKWSWHREFYDRAMKKIVDTAGKQYALFLDWYGEQPTGWLECFETYHPDQYRKYAEAMDRIINLWGKKDTASMEAWKKAVKIEVEATQWAVDKYVEHQKKILNGQAQEELVGA